MDPGLVQERTAFAWERTGFSLMLAGGLLLRGSGSSAVAYEVVAIVTIALGTWIVFVANVRYRLLRDAERTHAPVASVGFVRAVGVCTIAFAVASIVWCLA